MADTDAVPTTRLWGIGAPIGGSTVSKSDESRGGAPDRRGAKRDLQPAWMTNGFGIGTAMFGEGTGELLKPGLTKTDLEEIESRGFEGADPFGEIFAETSSGQTAIDRKGSKETCSPAASPEPEEEEDDEDPDAFIDPTYERLEMEAFEGVAGQQVDVPFGEDINPTKSFAVDFWVRPRGGSGYRSPLTSRDYPPPKGYAFFLTPKGDWQFWVGLPAKNEWLKVEGPRARTDEWQRITGMYSNKERCVTLFVDGEKVGSKPAPPSKNAPFKPNDRRPLRLGAGASEGSASKFMFTGDIGGLRVYRRVFEAEDLPLSDAPDEDPAAKRQKVDESSD